MDAKTTRVPVSCRAGLEPHRTHSRCLPFFRFFLAAALILRCALAGAAPPSSPPPPPPFQSSQVVDEQEKPLADVAVLLQNRPRILLPSHARTTTVTTTAADGHFELPADQTEGHDLLLSRPGFASLAFAGTAPLPRRIVLPPGRSLSGTVVDERGSSVSGALVGPFRPRRSAGDEERHVVHPVQFARTDAAGNFRVEGLLPEAYEFPVQASGRMPVLGSGDGTTTVVVTLRTGGTAVTGTVTGSRHGTPRAGIWVEARQGFLRQYARTDQEGRYAFPGLPSGEWILEPVVENSPTRSERIPFFLDGQTPEMTADLLVNEGARLAGMVMDSDTSLTLPGVPLRLEGPGGIREGTTAPDGTFAFENADAFGDLHLHVDTTTWTIIQTFVPAVAGSDYLLIPALRGQDLSTVTVHLRQRPAVSGRVVDPLGRPAFRPSITLRPLLATFPDTEPGDSTGEVRVKGDADGHFQCTVYPPGPYEAVASSENMISAPVAVEAFTTSTEKLLLRLKPGLNIYGSTTDSSDQAVTGALVRAIPTGTTSGGTTETRSRLSGTFEFPGLVPRGYLFRATHPDYVRPAEVGFDPEATTASQPLHLRFAPGANFSAVVTDGDDRPVQGAEVILYFMEGHRGESLTRKTDAGGRIVVRGVPAPQLERLDVRHGNYVPVESGPMPLPVSDFPVHLQRRGNITVRVEPVPETASDLRVTLLMASGAGRQHGTDAPPAADHFVLRDENALQEGKAEFPNLEPGWYKAQFQAGGLFAESEPVQLGAGGDNTREIRLTPAAPGGIAGQVTDKESGSPIEGVLVSVEPAAQRPASIPPQTTLTDAGGRYTFTEVPAGSMKVTASKPPYPPLSRTVRVTEGHMADGSLAFSLQLSSLAGRVTVGSQPVEGALLVLTPAGTGDDGAIATALSGASGQYEMTGLPIGAYTLLAEAPVGTGDHVAQRTFQLEVGASGATQDVSFRSPVSIRGTVRVGGMAADPARGASVLLFSSLDGGGSVTVPVNADATFSAQLEPGRYSVGLEDRPGKEISIPEKPAASLDLSF